VSGGVFWHGAFSPTVFFCDLSVSTDTTDGLLPGERVRPPRKSRRERERALDLAITKATEPKRRIVISQEPWLAEPIMPPAVLPVPEFNPELAALAGRAALIQSEIDRLKFIREQEDADIELLLLSI